MKIADFAISKLSFTDGHRIDSVSVVELDENNKFISEFENKDRNWMIQKQRIGKQFCSITKDLKGKWSKKTMFTYDSVNDIFSWGFSLPNNSTKHKTFVSYYHFDDNNSRAEYEGLFGDLIVSMSVEKDEIDSDNSDEYIKQLIQKEYLKDTTVLVVLVGPNTKHRKHVDWEISGAISLKVGDNSGLLGIILPSHPDFGKEKVNYENLPVRLAANAKSGYARIYDWTEDRTLMQKYIHDAFERRKEVDKRITTSIPQMKEDTN